MNKPTARVNQKGFMVEMTVLINKKGKGRKRDEITYSAANIVPIKITLLDD